MTVSSIITISVKTLKMETEMESKGSLTSDLLSQKNVLISN